MTAIEGRFEPESGTLPALVRWGVAGSLVVALHGAVAFALLNPAPVEAPPAGVPEEAILIDLAPPVESEAAPPPPEVTLPEPVAEPPPPEPIVEPTPPEPVPPEPVPEPPEPVPEPVVEPLPEPVPPEPVVEPLPEPEPPPPEPVEEPLPEPPVVQEIAPVPGNVPLPTLRPPPPRPPEPRAEPRRAERAEPRRQREEPPRRQQPRRQAAQPPASTASRGAPERQASQGAPVSAAARDRWQSRVQARINRFKRTPRGGGSGTVVVAFGMDASGRVTSARVSRSAGGTLDEAALALVRRAGPYPAPPSGSSITITVPIQFN